MQLIKNQQLVNDQWLRLSDDDALVTGNIIVSLNRWQQDKSELVKRDGAVGVKLAPADDVASIANDLAHWQLVELYFPDFADGRLFSTAWLLRERYGFKGEIRATGQFMPDQAFYLARVGVDAFQPANSAVLSGTLACLADFSVNYQVSVN